MQTLQRDLQKVRYDLGDLANALYEAGREGADSAKGQFNDRMQRIGGAYQSARKRGDQMVDTMTERPMATALGAFAIGLVFAGLVAMASMMKRPR
ncbi:MAG: hypothetical protein WDZ31_08125 [Phycisphaeraceae bacterium]